MTGWILERLGWFLPLLVALSVHEWAHAWTARRLGDPTAESQGRLTLDPSAHIDLVGTVLLPIVGVPFGWARPVPIDPLRFSRSVSMRTGVLIAAAAGPVSNFVLALVSLAAVAGLTAIGPPDLPLARGLLALLRRFYLLNVLLGIFNLIPLPPLDGSRVVDGLLPDRFAGPWSALKQLGPLPLALLILVPILVGWSPFSSVFQAAASVLHTVEHAL